jgi:hypothetical protein
MKNTPTPIRHGDRVRIKPEWQDPGDDEFVWTAVENEAGGRVRIRPVMDLQIPPSYVVTTEMIEHEGIQVCRKQSGVCGL